MSQSQPPFSLSLVSSNLIFHCYWFPANSFFIFHCYWFPVISFFIVIGFQQPHFLLLLVPSNLLFLLLVPSNLLFILLLVSNNLLFILLLMSCLSLHNSKNFIYKKDGGIYSGRSIAIFSSNRQMMGTDEHGIYTG